MKFTPTKNNNRPHAARPTLLMELFLPPSWFTTFFTRFRFAGNFDCAMRCYRIWYIREQIATMLFTIGCWNLVLSDEEISQLRKQHYASAQRPATPPSLGGERMGTGVAWNGFMGPGRKSFPVTTVTTQLNEMRQKVDRIERVHFYRAGRPIIRKVLKTRIWVVPPVCLGSR